MIPLPGLLTNDGDTTDHATAQREAICTLLQQRGPTSREATECWFDRRTDLLIATELCELFEAGRVDFKWNADRSQVLIQRVDPPR